MLNTEERSTTDSRKKPDPDVFSVAASYSLGDHMLIQKAYDTMVNMGGIRVHSCLQVVI